MNLVVVNKFGQQVLNTKLISGSTKVDISNASKGVYFVRVLSSNANEVKKIVIE